MSRTRKLRLVAAALVAPLLLTACTRAAEPAAPAAAEQPVVTNKIKAPAKTLGIWQSQGDGEGQVETLAGIKAAADALGWKVVVTDSNGDQQAMQSTMQSLISQKVDAILTVFVASGLIAAQLAQAKAAGIPVLSVGYQGTPNPNITAEYAPDQAEEAKLLLERMGKDLGDKAKIAPIAVQGYYGIDQVMAALEAQKGQYGFNVLQTANAPVADIFNGQTKAASSFLNANPDLSAFYAALDIGPQAIAPALKQTGREVPIYSFGAISSALDAVRSGQAIVATSDGTAKAGFLAIDALLALWVSNTPIPTEIPADQALTYQIIDKTNAPAKGAAVYLLTEISKPFFDSWTTKYGAA
ncbi:sugar ABC transporter substrate-binding protein [Actinoplanes bogorensis]|uniref:Sugar ABC transporter substrate-binding protein n=1 Tax=Paractinoplanes bogorensis TaxID=1610840 RepID=A0ABS5YXI9_9ACTN|nr:sugar ABC transporter substrate-binding protein [Actinoplanes bogorensis]MBU2668165.1 sugar ABC transporter substrate-binding protein [Actinoplanes bogorensis]